MSSSEGKGSFLMHLVDSYAYVLRDGEDGRGQSPLLSRERELTLELIRLEAEKAELGMELPRETLIRYLEASADLCDIWAQRRGYFILDDNFDIKDVIAGKQPRTFGDEFRDLAKERRELALRLRGEDGCKL